VFVFSNKTSVFVKGPKTIITSREDRTACFGFFFFVLCLASFFCFLFFPYVSVGRQAPVGKKCPYWGDVKPGDYEPASCNKKWAVVGLAGNRRLNVKADAGWLCGMDRRQDEMFQYLAEGRVSRNIGP